MTLVAHATGFEEARHGMCDSHQRRVGDVVANWRLAVVCWGLLGNALVFAAEPVRPAASPSEAPLPVVLKLHWYPQAQFAGYLLAHDKGFFRAAGLGDVEIRWSTAGERCLDSLAERGTVVCTGWLCDAIVRRAHGAPIVHLAQVTQKSAMLLVTRQASGIVKPADMTGKRVGMWGGDFDVLPRAFFRKFQIQPEIVPQSNSIVPFLRGAVSVASAMHYNEYHRLLDAGLRPEELRVFTLAEYGLDFPEDGLYCHPRCWRDDTGKCLALVQGVRQGWDYALRHEAEALDVVMTYCRRAEVRTSRNHQQWMLRSMAGLIRDVPDAISPRWGELSATVYEAVGRELLDQGLLKAVPSFAEFHRPAQPPRKGF